MRYARRLCPLSSSRMSAHIGLSATPLKWELGNYYQGVVNAAVTNQLISDGYLAPLKIVAAQAEVNVDGLKLNSLGEWNKDDLSGRVKVITGDMVREWEKNTTKYFGGPVMT